MTLDDEPIKSKLELLARLPVVRYAFVPGFNGNPEGNSAPNSQLITANGELALTTAFQREPIPLSELFSGYELQIAVDGNGYYCVQGTNGAGNIREIAPALPAYYLRDDEASANLIQGHFTPA